jgi:hypothetical protein
MKPITFPEQTCVYAEHQPEYMPLPAFRAGDGTVTTCWKLTWRERLTMLLTGKMWLSVLTFNQSLQPLKPEARKPAWLKGGW